MSTYNQIAWLPLCAGLTGLGLVLSYLVMRRRGAGAGLRLAALSLLPLAAYLTGSIEMFWKMGVAIGDFAKGFVFSPRVWSGIAVAGAGRGAAYSVRPAAAKGRGLKPGQDKRAAEAGSGAAGAVTANPRAAAGQLATRPASPAPAKAPSKARKGKDADDDDDLGDVADILRRHGIT